MMSVKERMLSLELIEMNKKNPKFLRKVGVTATIAEKERVKDLNKNCGSTPQKAEE